MCVYLRWFMWCEKDVLCESMFMRNVYWYDLRDDLILLWKWLHARFDIFCEIKCLIDKLICVGIYDLTKMIYQRTSRKGFRKTPLSYLDLHFKILIFQDRVFRSSREEGSRICGRWFRVFWKWLSHSYLVKVL